MVVGDGKMAHRRASVSHPGVSNYALEVNQAMLKEDDDLLRNTFLSVFRHHHPQLANKVDVIFALSQVWWRSGGGVVLGLEGFRHDAAGGSSEGGLRE